jgi:hypothetical protein
LLCRSFLCFRLSSHLKLDHRNFIFKKEVQGICCEELFSKWPTFIHQTCL